jgi:predicted NBD/HSP70 family sugar kinase
LTILRQSHTLICAKQESKMKANTQKDRVLRPGQVRGANSSVVLEMLRQNESLSRAELARITGLSEGTVSRIVAELIGRKFVMEDGIENSTGGRPSTRLRLEQNRYAVGVDIRAWETRFAVGTMRGTTMETNSIRTPSDPKATISMIAEQYAGYRNQFGKDRLEGLGISIRGIVDSRTGIVELGSDPKWVKIPVKQQLEAELKVPVYVENNVRAAALAEYTYGDSGTHNSRCLLFVAVEEGIGIGIVLDGKLYNGPRMAGGEFGQMVIKDSDGPERYDRPGCLEKLASNIALCGRYTALTKGKSSPPSGSVTSLVRLICHRAMEGDEAAKKALKVTMRYLGIGIANVVWGLDADMVIVSGSINLAWPLVAQEILDQFPESVQTVTRSTLVLRPSTSGDEAPLLGAATLAFNNMFAAQRRVRR